MTLALNELIRARELSRYCLSKALQISVEELLLFRNGKLHGRKWKTWGKGMWRKMQ
ncbi:MAG: hypothetical protein K2H37_01210 [Lachnospiraceae bacterium]|nr:hypothetical protein [Lachnospiraceae bacterium]